MIILGVTLTGPLLVAMSGKIRFSEDWRVADRSSAQISPLPAENPEAIVQVFSARAFNWRGLFGVHTWIATKQKNAEFYTVHQVVGWRSWDDLPVVVSKEDIPDRLWYGYKPDIIAVLHGDEAESAIRDIELAVADYPYQYRYRMWPGPNSNTFVAEIGRRVEKLELNLPATAIGKDFLTENRFIDKTPSASGWQFSLFGLIGVSLAKKEGLEINLLGFNYGINPLSFVFKLPGIGSFRLSGDD